MPNMMNHNIRQNLKHNTVKDYINRTVPSKVKIVKNSQQMLGKDSFLKLLIQELKHQDPLKPMNDKEFISQMAQFSSLEQMNNVSKSMESLKRFQANFLVGKTITGKDFVTGRYIRGTVQKVLHDGKGNAFLRVNGKSIKFEDISEVENTISNQNNIYPPQNSYYQRSKQMYKNVSRETSKTNRPKNIEINQQQNTKQSNHLNTKTGTSTTKKRINQ